MCMYVGRRRGGGTGAYVGACVGVCARQPRFDDPHNGTLIIDSITVRKPSTIVIISVRGAAYFVHLN